MPPVAIDVISDDDGFIVRLAEGGELRFSFECFPKLKAATPQQRHDVRISASGAGLHWDQLNEVITINKLMRDGERHHLQKRLKSVGIAVKVDSDKL